MKHLKTISIFTALLIVTSVKAQATISLDDFIILNNTSWEGTLTYLDYQSGELVPVSTTMQIRVTPMAIEQDIQYTWEPNKNIKATTKIKKKGTYLGKQEVISILKKEDGTIQLTTTAEGKDDNKKATMRYTYEFNDNTYKVTKEVVFEGSDEYIMRNTYDYKKINL